MDIHILGARFHRIGFVMLSQVEVWLGMGILVPHVHIWVFVVLNRFVGFGG